MKIAEQNDNPIYTVHTATVEMNGKAAVEMTHEQWETFLGCFRRYLDKGLTKVTVWVGTGGLPDTYIYVVWTFATGNPLHMGIDQEGRSST